MKNSDSNPSICSRLVTEHSLPDATQDIITLSQPVKPLETCKGKKKCKADHDEKRIPSEPRWYTDTWSCVCQF